MAMLNIAQGDKAFFINPAEVTAIQYFAQQDVIVITTTEGSMQPMGAKDWNLDIADIAKKIADSGFPLVSSPMRQEGKEYPAYISPAAITFITTAQKDGKPGMGLIAGVKGLGRHEIYDAKPEEILALIMAATADREFLKYTPDVAHARWYDAKELYIDPMAVTQIRNFQGEQVDIDFDGCGRLDVQIWSKNRFSHPAPEPQGSIEEWREAMQVWKKDLADAEIKTAALKESLVADISVANPSLVKMPTTRGIFYVLPQSVAYAFCSAAGSGKKDDISLTVYGRKSPAVAHPMPLTMYFESAAKQEEAIKLLTGDTQKPSKPDTPRP